MVKSIAYLDYLYMKSNYSRYHFNSHPQRILYSRRKTRFWVGHTYKVDWYEIFSHSTYDTILCHFSLFNGLLPRAPILLRKVRMRYINGK